MPLASEVHCEQLVQEHAASGLVGKCLDDDTVLTCAVKFVRGMRQVPEVNNNKLR